MTFLSTLKKSAQVAGDVLTTKGDILSRSASALGRLAVGSNDQVLTADSSQTLGIKWATSTGASLGANTFTGDQDLNDNSIFDIEYLRLANDTTLTISSGTVATTQSYHNIDTEGGASTDDLNTATNVNTGAFLILRPANASRTVVIKDVAGGAGQFSTAGDFSMDSGGDIIEFIETPTNVWGELTRSSNN